MSPIPLFARKPAGFAVAFLGYTLLTLLQFRGLIGQLSTSAPHDLGDPILSTWILWWNAHHLPFVGNWWNGLAFFPVHGSLAFSDHRVGLALIASPVQWAGGSPVLAYNVTLLATYVLSAMAAHALTWVLTRDHAAAAVSGLVFGFNPFRASHIAHLELLAAFWLPLALVALHRYVERSDARWLWLFGASWAMQGLSSGYYFLYSAPLIGLWIVWFARGSTGAMLRIAAAGAAATVVLSPVLLGYRSIQSQLDLSRGFAEVEEFSADIMGVFSATPQMALWRIPSFAANGEADIYVGIVAPLLVLAGWLRRPSRTGEPTGRGLRIFRTVTAVLFVTFAAVGAGTLAGPWSVALGPVSLSVTRHERPLMIAALCLGLLCATSRTLRDAMSRRSTFAFYVVAGIVSWIFAVGPRPSFLGTWLLYRGPYELLMLFPGFDSGLRAPARFAMIVAFCLATAAGLAFVRVTAGVRGARKAALAAPVLLLIAADSWILSLPFPAAPRFFQLPAGVPESAVVLELPLGNIETDIAAVYRSIGHEHPVVNGYSGYEPPHYAVLKSGLARRDASALAALTAYAPVVAAVDRGGDGDGGWAAFAGAQAGVIRLGDGPTHAFFLLPLRRPPSKPSSAPLRLVRASGATGAVDELIDGRLDTARVSPDGTGELVFELDGLRDMAGVSLARAQSWKNFPAEITVSVSADGMSWRDTWRGGTAGAVIEAVLANPRAVRCRLPFEATQVRFIRLRAVAARAADGWALSELVAEGPR